MADSVKHSSNQSSASGWQTLGELKVYAGAGMESAVQAWVINTLQPLELHADLLNKISRSAWEAAMRVLESKGNTLNDRHIHLLIFAPASQPRAGLTWGFFRLEKLEDFPLNKDPADHLIEFYLYCEGASADGNRAP